MLMVRSPCITLKRLLKRSNAPLLTAPLRADRSLKSSGSIRANRSRSLSILEVLFRNIIKNIKKETRFLASGIDIQSDHIEKCDFSTKRKTRRSQFTTTPSLLCHIAAHLSEFWKNCSKFSISQKCDTFS